MSFNPIAAIETVSILNALPENPTVVELGNQTFNVTDDVLKSVIAMLRQVERQVDVQTIQSFIGKTVEEKKPCTEAFYRAVGFSSYTAIDTNANYGSLMMDLNFDLRETYHFEQTFDLVTNNGTGEHVFNQYLIFKNMHDLTKAGGVMLHIMPFANWFNHCFYNFHPRLYADLAAANGYEIVKMSLANRWGTEIIINPSASHFVADSAAASLQHSLFAVLMQSVKTSNLAQSLKPVLRSIVPKRKVTQLSLDEAITQILPSPHSGFTSLGIALETLMRDEQKRVGSTFPVLGNVQVVAALKKVEDKPFCVPMQSMYVGSMTSHEMLDRYANQVNQQ